ncbi:MAG: histidine kinase [Flavobacteriales bacterium]
MTKVIDGVRESILSQPDSAIRILQAQWSRTSPAARELVGLDFYRTRAEARFNKQDMAGAKQDCDSAMRYCRIGRRELDMAWVNMLLGRLLAWSGDYGQASRLLEGSLAAYERNADYAHMIECNGHLGRVHFDQEQWALARRSWKAMLDLARRIGDHKAEAKALNAVGLAELYLVDPSVGHAYYDSALVAARKLKDARLLASIHNNIGIHMDSALYFAKISGDQALVYSILHTTGVLLMRKGDLAKGFECCGQALTFARKQGNLGLERDALQCLSEAYRLSGDWKRAFQKMEEWQHINGQMISSRSRDETSMLAIAGDIRARQFEDSLRYTVELERIGKEKVIQSLRADRNRNRVFALGLGAVLLLGGTLVFFRIDRKRRRERFERDAARLQTQILRTQMNPHFIFNALNSINNYVQTSDRELASGFLTKFARLMRLVLENSRHTEVPLAQDLEAIRLYMDLERARMNEKFDYAIDVDPAIDQETTLVPPLVVQPFVENAIWHGISRKEGKGHIRLTVRREDTRLVLTIEDDGVGRSAAALPLPLDAPPQSSLGTAITRDRLATLGKQQGSSSGFHFVDLAKGTRVEVVMPLMHEN